LTFLRGAQSCIGAYAETLKCVPVCWMWLFCAVCSASGDLSAAFPNPLTPDNPRIYQGERLCSPITPLLIISAASTISHTSLKYFQGQLRFIRANLAFTDNC